MTPEIVPTLADVETPVSAFATGTPTSPTVLTLVVATLPVIGTVIFVGADHLTTTTPGPPAPPTVVVMPVEPFALLAAPPPPPYKPPAPPVAGLLLLPFVPPPPA